MAMYPNPNQIIYPFTVTGICPNQQCARELPSFTADTPEDLTGIVCPWCKRRVVVSDNGKTLTAGESTDHR